MEGPPAPCARLPRAGPPGSNVILMMPAPGCVGEALYPRVVNGTGQTPLQDGLSRAVWRGRESWEHKEFQATGPGPLARIFKVNFWVSPSPLTPCDNLSPDPWGIPLSNPGVALSLTLKITPYLTLGYRLPESSDRPIL